VHGTTVDKLRHLVKVPVLLLKAEQVGRMRDVTCDL